MMNKHNPNPRAHWKALLFIPLAALLALAFARPEINRELEQISTLKGTEILQENTGWTEEKIPKEHHNCFPEDVSPPEIVIDMYVVTNSNSMDALRSHHRYSVPPAAIKESEFKLILPMRKGTRYSFAICSDEKSLVEAKLHIYNQKGVLKLKESLYISKTDETHQYLDFECEASNAYSLLLRFETQPPTGAIEITTK